MHALPESDPDFLEEPDIPGGMLADDLPIVPGMTGVAVAAEPLPQPDKPDERGKQMKATSENIGRLVDDITHGRSSGEHTALDKLIGPDSKHWPNTVCRPDCPHRKPPPEEVAPPGPGPMITDVFPTVSERVYGLERDMHHLRYDFRQHRDDSLREGERKATKDQLNDLERNMYTELDEVKDNMKEGFKNANARINKRTAWLVIQTFALLVSTAYGLILSYKHFIQP